MKRNKSTLYFAILYFIGSLLSVISFPPCSLSFFIWFSLIPILFTLKFQSYKQILITHSIFTLVFFGIGSFWLTSVHFLTLISLLFPLYFVCLPFPLITSYILKNSKLPIFFVAPIVWCSIEYIRSFIFSGYPYLFLGYTQAFHPTIIQIADITGVYGISFIIVMVNSFFVEIINFILGYSKNNNEFFEKNLKNLILYGIILLILVGSIFYYGEYCLKNIKYKKGPILASIQGNIPQDIKDNPFINRKRILESYTYLSVKALKSKKIDILIWPETMSPDDLNMDPEIFLLFKDMASYTNTYLLIGSHHYKCDFEKKEYKVFNSAYFLNNKGNILQIYNKINLVPVGEYIPGVNFFPFLSNIILNIVGFYPDLKRGEKFTIFNYKSYKFGTLICYDVAFSDEIRKLASKGADFLINITNEGWFAYSCELEHLLQISILRAVECRIGIFRSGNTGITINIPPNGVINYSKDILIIPIKDYYSSLQEYIKDRIKGKRVIAYNHFSYLKDFFPYLKDNWDIKIGNKYYKWKDFPGFFITSVYLKSYNKKSYYLKFGDIFSYLNLFLTFIFLVISYSFSKFNKN